MIKAVIFDMDGVISDTQVIQANAESELLREYGVTMSAAEITQKYAGASDREFFTRVFEEHGKPVPSLDKIIREKWERLMGSGLSIKAIPGSIELIRACRANKLSLAVASSSRLDFIEFVLPSLGIRDQFDTIASSEEVRQGKPAPDVFLLAARRLNVTPEACVVIEDGIHGMIGAKKAGMKCIGLVFHPETREYPCDLIVKSLRDLTFGRIMEM